jgi:hypothetical protein
MYVFSPHLLIFVDYSLNGIDDLLLLSRLGDIMNPDSFSQNLYVNRIDLCWEGGQPEKTAL